MQLVVPSGNVYLFLSTEISELLLFMAAADTRMHLYCGLILIVFCNFDMQFYY